MKKMNLCTFEVQELNQQEMLENEGGSLIAIGIALLVVAVCASSCATYRTVQGTGKYEAKDAVEQEEQ